MREIIKHRGGRIFLFILALTLVFILCVPNFFTSDVLLWGFITLPFFSGTVLLLIWLVAYLVYFFFFWPYRH